MFKPLQGFICAYSQVGSEGVTDLLFYEVIEGRDHPKFHQIKEGYYLKIFDEKGEIFFEGTVKYSKTPKRGRRIRRFKGGLRVSWVQEGFKPREWATLFFWSEVVGSNGKNLRAELCRPYVP